jgi:peroxiredoxin
LPLLSDWNGEATEAFGLAREFAGFKGIPLRSAFLIDQDGTVRASWAYDDSALPDFDELLRAAQALSG